MTTLAPAAPPTDYAAEPLPLRHNRYAAEDFFRCDAAAGVVTAHDGRRVVRVSGDFLAALTRALEREVGDAAATILYETGRRWGADDMAAFATRAPQEFGTDYEKVHMDVLLETWWWSYAAGGWGTWRFDFTRAPQRLVFLEVRDSAAARALAGAGRPVCHLYAGAFAGAMGFLARRGLACTELQCRAAGADVCRFFASTPDKVKAATEWRDAGEPAAEITRRLTEPA
jgi:predicted hydrocarbon binding protein